MQQLNVFVMLETELWLEITGSGHSRWQSATIGQQVMQGGNRWGRSLEETCRPDDYYRCWKWNRG